MTRITLGEAGLVLKNLFRIGIGRQFRKPPVIIGGCGRSGTTLLLSILASHPSIFAIPYETHCFCRTAYTDSPDLDRALRVGEFYRLLLRSEIPREAVRWCEKTPKNVLLFGQLLERFRGRVRLIHVVRDCRDVVTSRHPEDREGTYHVSPERWVADVTAGLRFRDHEQVLTLRYEDLVGSFEESLDRLGDFLDEDMSGLAARWHTDTSVKESAAWSTGVRPVSGRSVQRWKEPEHQDRVEQAMGMPEVVSLLDELGYPT